MTSDERVRRLTPDEFMHFLIYDIGKYYFDEETQTLRHTKNDKVVNPYLNSQGYYSYKMVYNREIVKEIKAHRLIAMVYYGIEAITGKHVAHLDEPKTNNNIENLEPMTPRDHVFFDGTHKNLKPREFKKEWKPCVKCGDPNGLSCRNTTPDRISGKKFDIDGKLCRTCYHALLSKTY